MNNDVPEDLMHPDNLKRALKKFRKRLKLTRLDSESTLGGSSLTAGKRSGIMAIRPPNDYPREVWEKLVETGKLKREQGGLYELVEDLKPN